MALKQKVTLEIHDKPKAGNLILRTSDLRVDFDIRVIPGFSQAKFVIYNLNNSSVTNLMSGDRYVTLKTQLHGGKEYTLANRFFVNNAVDELILPNRIVSLFCFDLLRKEVLQEQVNINVDAPTLKRMVAQTLKEAGHTGGVKYESFPQGLIDQKGDRSVRPLQGSVQQILRRLGKEFNFNLYTENGTLVFVYKPDLDNVGKTDLGSKEVHVLTNNAMRSTPKIGMASALVVSNLDPRIKPSTVLDLSKLLTIAADAPEKDLELVDNYLKNFSSYTKYQAFNVQHKGSNYTNEWITNVTAFSPSKGNHMPTVAWGQPRS
jgi:hypothetical protein